MKLSAYGLSTPGRGRKRNEDYYCLGPFVGQADGTGIEIDNSSSFFRKYGLLAAVADGSSPSLGGELASRVLLETLMEQFYSSKHEEAESGAYRAGIAEYIELAEKQMQKALEDTEMVDASTTLAGFALFDPDTVVIFHIGDCRVLRECAGFIRPMTGDHTSFAPEPLQTKYAVIYDEPRPMPLTRTVSFFENAQPEIRIFNWGSGDTYMAGTKGWHGANKGVTRDTIKGSLYVRNDIAQFVASSLEDAIRVDGSDEATLVAIRVIA